MTLAWLVLAGCGVVEGERGACEEPARGRFDILDGGTFDGRVYDGEPPGERVAVSVFGACELLVRTTCDLPCTSDEICTTAGVCAPFPRTIDVGTVRLERAGRDRRIEPTTPGATYFEALDDLAPGTPLRLQVADQTLATTVVEPLDVAAEWRLPGPIDVRWTPSTRPGATIEVRVAVDQHGASQGELRCTFDDEGAAAIPAETVQALVDVGVSGFASGSIRRQRVDHAVIDGRCTELASVSVDLATVRVDR